MAEKSTTALETPLRDQLDRLASIDPGSFVSVYLDLRPDQNGQRNHIDTFLKNSFDEQTRSMTGDPRRAFDDVHERIRQHLQAQDAPAKGMVIFASTTGDLFETIPLDVP